MSNKKYNKTFAIDAVTGEAVGQIIPVESTASLRKETGFYMADKSWSAKLAKDKDLRGQPTTILLYMLSKIENGNRVIVSPTFISKELNIHRTSVYNALNKLIEKDILQKEETGVKGVYFFNPGYFWCGEREKAYKNKH